MISSLWKILCVAIPAAGISALALDVDFFARRQVDTAGLVSFWKMEQAGAASVGSVSLSSTNGLTYTTGRFNEFAASCTSQRWFKTSTNVTLSNNFTVSFWARRLYAPGAGQGTFGMPFGGITTAQGFFHITTNAVDFYNDGTTKFISAAHVSPSNQWTHYALTCGSNLALYVNGSRIVQSNYVAPFVLTVQMVGNAFTGAAENGQRYVWRGLLDDFRVYDRQKQPSEIAVIYGEQAP